MPNFINNLQAYNTSRGNIKQLDLWRDLAISREDYYYRGVVLPGSNRDRLDPLETFESQFDIPPGSYLTAISAYSEMEAGFVMQCTEVSSQAEIWSGMSIRSTLVGQFGGNPAEDIPIGPTVVASPMIVLNKGRLNLELKNMSSNANRINVLFEFAVPINSGTMNRVGVAEA